MKISIILERYKQNLTTESVIKREGITLKTKTAIVFLSGSAGELDWILPILDHLLKREFDLKIIFLT